MNYSPTLSADEFRDIHNALCDLDSVAQSLEDVLRPEKYLRLIRARDAIRGALKNAYELEREVSDRRYRYYDDIQKEMKFRTDWSIYSVDSMYDEHPYTAAEALLYKDHWGEKHMSAKIEGNRWIDLWRAADECIRNSGDNHHMFIEAFTPYNKGDNTVLVLSTGS